jgi:hypothetical protein
VPERRRLGPRRRGSGEEGEEGEEGRGGSQTRKSDSTAAATTSTASVVGAANHARERLCLRRHERSRRESDPT